MMWLHVVVQTLARPSEIGACELVPGFRISPTLQVFENESLRRRNSSRLTPSSKRLSSPPTLSNSSLRLLLKVWNL